MYKKTTKNINFLFYPASESTNNSARRLYHDKKAADGDVIYTDLQTLGKGRGNNRWYSAKDDSLCMSQIIEPRDLLIEDFFKLHILVSVSIINCLTKLIEDSSPLSIKWPNDIYYGNKKLAGILINNDIVAHKIQNTIIGIGININNKSFPKELPNPISLWQITNKTSNIKECMHKIASSIYQAKEEFNEIFPSLKETYTQELFQLNTEAKYGIQNKEYSGIIRGINQEGKLVLEIKKNIHAFDMDDISYIL